jgi:hypothetical protein
MIIFELSCTQGHRFEGWFGSTDEFGRQSDAQMVRCPLCDDSGVTIVPTAKVHVGRPVPERAPATVPDEKSGPGELIAGLPPELVRQLREVVRATENVGRRFPEEARKIHYDEVPPRPIRGHATADEADELRAEGIEFAPLPSFLTRESH